MKEREQIPNIFLQLPENTQTHLGKDGPHNLQPVQNGQWGHPTSIINPF
jgi:hypothetical protein